MVVRRKENAGIDAESRGEDKTKGGEASGFSVCLGNQTFNIRLESSVKM